MMLHNPCFNLVIESLLISTPDNDMLAFSSFAFQSRNRESSNFNRGCRKIVHPTAIGFNLVIESLLISTVEFNHNQEKRRMFQSRNRESSNFNFIPDNLRRCLCMFQSRNRESSNFNRPSAKRSAKASSSVSIS